ncbi:MAG: RecX family transcriptional regulator [Alphaproteobacteria bacterium]|nr:RecX family transcriptional regulator [Alphaproteobacteria bacterium]MCB9975432.1 RecX family transcriptional regulator [Rhodospirillales bacterium]
MGQSKHKEEQTPVNRQRRESRKSETGKKRLPRRITESYLHNSGLFYLQRFSASKAHFKRVMMRKVKRSCAAHTDQDFETCRALVEKLAERFEGSGLLNDALFARGLALSLRRQGRSRKAIFAKMTERGLKAEQIEVALERLSEEYGTDDREEEREAALRFARKRRLGPYRRGGAGASDPSVLKKELGAFARAGFSYETARGILLAENDEDALF